MRDLVDDLNTTLRVVGGSRYSMRPLCCPHCKGEIVLEDSRLYCIEPSGCRWSGEALGELEIGI